jgi:CheY-like chemotaxis protein
VAHDLIKEEQPDVVILDTWIEDKESGWILLQTLLLDEATSNIPIVIATAEVTEYEERAASREDLHTIRMLRKPFLPDQLTKAVREAVDGKGPTTV